MSGHTVWLEYYERYSTSPVRRGTRGNDSCRSDRMEHCKGYPTRHLRSWSTSGRHTCTSAHHDLHAIIWGQSYCKLSYDCNVQSRHVGFHNQHEHIFCNQRDGHNFRDSQLQSIYQDCNIHSHDQPFLGRPVQRDSNHGYPRCKWVAYDCSVLMGIQYRKRSSNHQGVGAKEMGS